MKRKTRKKKWTLLPQKDFNYWFGEWIVSSIVLKSWDEKHGGQPTRFHIPKQVLHELPDGDGELKFDVQWD